MVVGHGRDRGRRPVLVTKGAPEAVLARCVDVPAEAAAVLERLFARRRPRGRGRRPRSLR